jgi:hypothetical protein
MTMIVVSVRVSSRVGQVTLRNSARVSLKYFTIAFSLRVVVVAAPDFDFATITALLSIIIGQNSQQMPLIWFHDAFDESGIWDRISSVRDGSGHCGDFFGWCNSVHYILCKPT